MVSEGPDRAKPGFSKIPYSTLPPDGHRWQSVDQVGPQNAKAVFLPAGFRPAGPQACFAAHRGPTSCSGVI